MSKRGLFKSIAVLATLNLALVPAAQAQFGGFGLGNIVGNAKTVKKGVDGVRPIGEAEEIKIGAGLAGLILGASPLVSDVGQQRYVNQLGQWLALHSERPNLPWKFGIIDTEDFNAFSTPGGYVLISRGLFESMRNESELAGVLAHEIAHAVRKHHLSAIQKDNLTSAATDIGGQAVGGGLAGQLSAQMIKSFKNLLLRGLDKGDEYEADRMGVVIAARSGYSPYGLVGVLQTLSAAPTDGGFALMTKTHPTPVSRIAQLDAAMGTRLDGLTNVVDDLPSFAAIQNPPVAPAPPPVQPKAPARGQGRPRAK
jgi:predicted Zn-dependent protease